MKNEMLYHGQVVDLHDLNEQERQLHMLLKLQQKMQLIKLKLFTEWNL
jgi:hypothetical protein